MTFPARWPIPVSVTIVILVGSVLVSRYSGPHDSAAGPASPAVAGGRVPAAPSPVVPLDLERLRRQRDTLAASGRDLFRFKPRAAPSPPPRPAQSPVGAAPAGPVVPAGPPPPPPIQLKFIGLVEAPTRVGRLAILSDAKGNVFYGKEGDIIDGRYRVLKIGAESAELAYTDGRGRQVIRLTGQ